MNENEYIVVKKTSQEPTRNIYKGSKEDCEFVKNIMSEYHKYEENTSIDVIGIYTKYSNLYEFLKDYEYEYNYLKKEIKFSKKDK